MSRILKHTVELSVYESIDALADSDKELMLRAKKVSKTAYAPYSQFYVGAAIRLSSNEIIANLVVFGASFFCRGHGNLREFV